MSTPHEFPTLYRRAHPHFQPCGNQNLRFCWFLMLFLFTVLVEIWSLNKVLCPRRIMVYRLSLCQFADSRELIPHYSGLPLPLHPRYNAV
jgi:hypothetical protein